MLHLKYANCKKLWIMLSCYNDALNWEMWDSMPHDITFCSMVGGISLKYIYCILTQHILWLNSGYVDPYADAEPNNFNGNEDCMGIKNDFAGISADKFYWNDEDCVKTYPYICEKMGKFTIFTSLWY